jgi:outer membrane protein assembly factor BamB
MRRLVSLFAACLVAAGCGTSTPTPPPDGGAHSGPDATAEHPTGGDAGPGVSGADAAIRDGSAAAPAFDSGPPEPIVDAGASVLQHHKNSNRDGLYIEPTFTKAAISGTSGQPDAGSDGGAAGLHKDTAFNAVLPDPNDNVYAQPLFVDGLGGQDLIIVATEANNVYALDATTGAQVWVTHVGAPVPLSAKPCGNIDPFGVTGTPVIDFASRTVFFDAEVLPPGDAGVLPSHEIFALSIDTGAIKPGWPVNVHAAIAALGNNPSFNSPYQGQRGALAVFDGVVYVPYGGLFGACSAPGDALHYPQDTDATPFHGWIVGVAVSDPTQVQAWSVAAQGGGLWPPGGVSSDGTSLYATTGITFLTDGGWGGGDAVMRFGANAAFGAPLDSFAPGNWLALDNTDDGFGSAPVVFDLPSSTPGQLAIVFGKDGNSYLLDRAALGGIGRALGSDAGAGFYATLPTATAPIINAPVVYTTSAATYVAVRANGVSCTTGAGGDLTSLKIVPGSPPTLARSWCATGGAGSPIVTTSDGQSDAIVWQLGVYLDNRLHAFDGDTGAAIAFSGSTVTILGMRAYNTPIVAKGRLYVPADKAVVAFGL